MFCHLLTIWLCWINIKKDIRFQEIEICGGIILNGFLNSSGGSEIDWSAAGWRPIVKWIGLVQDGDR